jgi:7-cyano-7-deazaguanine synthase in queuosine biosynthesis
MFVRYVGTTRSCDDPSYLLAVSRQSSRIVLDPSSRARNITIEFSLDGDAVHLPLPAAVRDFLDLAACIYVADELVSRASAPDHWTRELDFLVPVRDPAVWEACRARLEATLSILSGDAFAFRWVPRTSIVASVRHRRRLPNDFDAVCLFSGGIDSFLGANALLKEGRRVLLVGHQADTTTAALQARLAGALKKRFGKRVSFLQCRVAQSLSPNVRHPLPEKVENSHRPRSFLFLALAVAAAAIRDVELIAIPENGLIGLNVPLQRSRFGTLSTRTAYPGFLLGFRETVRSLGLYAGALRNPFLAQSKTDLLATLDPALRTEVVQTVSCAKTGRVRWSGKKGIHHCGFCVPCIYRRVAMASAGLDSSSHYEDDVFRKLQTLAPTRQADLRALVQFAKRVVSLTDAERLLSVTSHGYFPPEELTSLGDGSVTSFSPLAAMTLRWSSQFLSLLRSACAARTRRLLAI